MQLLLVRHGATEWSEAHRHTGRTDVPLTDAGRADARRVGERLAGRSFARVLCSPLARAADTCRLAGFVGEPCDDLMEWDYGAYEGRTTKDIRAERPGWLLWRDGCPEGESADDVGARADRVLARLDPEPDAGDVAVFAHGHLLRVLTARWLGLPPSAGRLFALHTGATCTLGYERENRVIWSWNQS